MRAQAWWVKLLPLIGLAWAGSACDGAGGPAGPAVPSGDAGQATTVSYARDLKPLFISRCRICHNAGTNLGYDLDDPFDGALGMFKQINSWTADHDSPLEFLVVPGEPDQSFMVFKLERDATTIDPANNGSPMPLDVPRVTPGELADIKTWITDGASDDAFFRDNVAPVFGTAQSLGSKGGKCTLCHYPGNVTGLDVLAVFDAATGLVGVPSTLSDKPRVDPGDPDNSFLVEKIESATPSRGQQMPLHYPRFSNAELALLRTWIAEGAQNN